MTTPGKALILRATAWTNNAFLIRDGLVPLGYLSESMHVLDPTYGQGVFWKLWRPEKLTTHDLYTLDGVDFRNLPHPAGMFDAITYDPPYKLNGTPTKEVDERYGVDRVMSWQERHKLCREGGNECARVLARGGYLLWKCQDQVCSGRMHWQTDEFSAHAQRIGLRKIDRLDLLNRPRKQPPRTRADGKPSRQHHASANYSTMLVFQKP